MDFPDVSLVVQVGLPSDADSYTHRVGRTARAGKDGRAVILLTEAESFYLRVNPQFPIQPYPASTKIREQLDSEDLPITPVLQSVDPETKQKAYSAYLGFMKTHMNKLKLDPAGLVKMANQFALEGMLCDEVPKLERKTVGKMGLKGAPGISYATNRPAPASAQEDGPTSYASRARGPAPPAKHNKRPASSATNQERGPSRRLRHQ